VLEKKVFLFLDMKGSTGLVDKLGAICMKALVGKFLFDVSKPITDNGGEIYRFTGDGFVAMWDWDRAFRGGSVFRAVDDLFAVIKLEAPVYAETFGVVPEFRVGIHGGDIVGSEEGDNRRDIGFYGDTINIAARMEQKAKGIGYDCVVTAEVYERSDKGTDFSALGTETVRGIERPLDIYGYTPVPAP
jgi:class 3 adenylate cyclase